MIEWVEVVERTTEYIRLRYYPSLNKPEGEFGEVTYFFATDSWTFDKMAGSSHFAMHACNFARQYFKAGEEIPDNGMVAWY